MQIIGSNKTSLTAASLLSPPKVKSFAKDVLQAVSTDSGTLDKKVNREAFSAWSKASLKRIDNVFSELGSRAQEAMSPETSSAASDTAAVFSKTNLQTAPDFDLQHKDSRTKSTISQSSQIRSKESSLRYNALAKVLNENESGLNVDLYT